MDSTWEGFEGGGGGGGLADLCAAASAENKYVYFSVLARKMAEYCSVRSEVSNRILII